MSNASYVDKDFPPNENSLMGRNKNGLYLDPMESRNKIIKDSEVEWKRIVDIVAQPAIFEDTINMECVKFGRVSLPYFYCVFVTCCNNSLFSIFLLCFISYSKILSISFN